VLQVGRKAVAAIAQVAAERILEFGATVVPSYQEGLRAIVDEAAGRIGNSS
jgi:hypothetical protein